MDHISDIKLIRTDTTLDLSQKAEKGMSFTNQRLVLMSTEEVLRGFQTIAEQKVSYIFSSCMPMQGK
ncbi:unnamed protein product [Brassica oleracea]|uniref:Uncharacterized protein n=1 Tax=Brassica oleracea TaxID=3712 RepID=A0A3P6GJ95_BRAOL|nr:unnamed protein product [Brassica oleracea]